MNYTVSGNGSWTYNLQAMFFYQSEGLKLNVRKQSLSAVEFLYSWAFIYVDVTITCIEVYIGVY